MTSVATPLIALKQITQVYQAQTVETRALAGIDIQIDRGDYLAVEGPSGSGKSTLLSLLGLLEEPKSGSYILDGTPVHSMTARQRSRIRNREMGMVFQSFNLIPEMSVAENVALPLLYRSDLSEAQRRDGVSAALERVDLLSRANHRPSQLSGGQQQRVAIARAVVGSPSMILADEPTGNLDQDSGHRVMDLLEDLQRGGVTLIVVTHNPEFAARAAKRIRLVDGRISEVRCEP